MKQITLDGITYNLTPANQEEIERVETVEYYCVESALIDPAVKITTIIDPKTNKPFHSFALEINETLIDNEDWITNLYNYITKGGWDDTLEDKDYADSLSQEEKTAFMSVYERATELEWI